jgi:hypothetical protein
MSSLVIRWNNFNPLMNLGRDDELVSRNLRWQHAEDRESLRSVFLVLITILQATKKNVA